MGCNDQQSGQREVSKHVVEVENGAGLLELLSRSRGKAEQRYGVQVKAIVIEGSGIGTGSGSLSLAARQRDREPRRRRGFDRGLRRHRRAKTDAIDGETLLRTLMAWARGSAPVRRWFARRAGKTRIAGA